METRSVFGRDVKIGDAIEAPFRPLRVVALDAYNGPLAYLGAGEPIRIARFAEHGGMLILPTQTYEVRVAQMAYEIPVMKLRTSMFRKGLTPRQLAEKAGVDRSTVYSALRGEPQGLGVALKLSLALTEAPDRVGEDLIPNLKPALRAL